MNDKMEMYLKEMVEILSTEKLERHCGGIYPKCTQARSRLTDLNTWFQWESQALNGKAYTVAVATAKRQKRDAIFDNKIK